MLRIVEERMASNSTTLRLDGRLVGRWVELLLSSCEQVVRGDGGLVLDLSGVTFADHEGVRLLQRLEGGQVTFINCSPFLQEQIKSSTNNSPATE